MDGDKLYSGGPFDTINGDPVHRIVSIDNEVLDGAFTTVDGQNRLGLANSTSPAAVWIRPGTRI